MQKGKILGLNGKPLPEAGEIKIPLVQLRADHLPSYRAQSALKLGKLRDVMLVTRGGLGDAICSEPVLRFALKNFRKPFSLSVCTKYPSLFIHLPLKAAWLDSQDTRITRAEYYWATTYPNAGSLDWDFICHPYCNTVDAMSIAAWKCMMPTDEKDLVLASNPKWENLTKEEFNLLTNMRAARELVLVHPGATWQSRTFPVAWWQEVIEELKKLKITPVLIGAAARDKVGTVPVDATGCIDLRDRTSLDDFIRICQMATVVLTNDSSPIHLAASTFPGQDKFYEQPWIGYVATCRHPDFITHWRKAPPHTQIDGKPVPNGTNVWGYRMRNLGVDGLWNHEDYYHREKPMSLESYDYKLVESCLPEPKILAEFAQAKIR